MNKTKKEIFKKIRMEEVRMKPAWEFKAIKGAEVGTWLLSIGLMILAGVSIGYFVRIYNPRELAEFGDLGWQIFYEDFPYIWGVTAILSLIGGMMVWMKTGDNYKKSWQKSLLITLGVVLSITALTLYLKP